MVTVLLDNLPVQKFSHLALSSEFPISPRATLDALHAQPDEPRFGDLFPPTAGDGFVDRTEFIATEPHGTPPDRDLERSSASSRNGVQKSLAQDGLLRSLPEGGS
jgi:hypothetical protein